MTAYRDADTLHLQVFATHIKIAESLLDVVADSGARLRAQSGRFNDPVTEELLATRREAWGNLWTQLDEARKIVAGLGRDVTSFDAARARIGAELYLVVAGASHFKTDMPDAAAAAIAALRTAVPEVVIPVSPTSEYRDPIRYVHWGDPEARRSMVLRVAIMLGILFVLAVIALKIVDAVEDSHSHFSDTWEPRTTTPR
jgi:hypothetical protein